jgi:hypothetical protein
MQQALLIAVNKDDRPPFIGGSDGLSTGGTREPVPLPLWPCAPANARASSISVAHAEFVATLAEHPPRTIPTEADAIDLEDRADHLDKVFSALSVYLTVILDDTAQNAPGRIDLRDAEAVLSDLASDLTGTIQLAADHMAGRVA